MRNKIFLLTALLIAGFTVDASAQMAHMNKRKITASKQKTVNNVSQEITWSVRTGLNISNIKGYYDKAKAGFHIGALVDIPVSLPITGFSVQSGLFYTMRGSKYSDEYGESQTSYPYQYLLVEVKNKNVSHYFQIPVWASYKYDFGAVALSAFTGPYMAVGIAGKYKENRDKLYGDEYQHHDKYRYNMFGKESKPYEYNEKKSDERTSVYDGGNLALKRFDIGWSIGVGVTYKYTYLGVQYDFGFIDMSRIDDKIKVLNRNFSLSVGYTF